MILSTVRIKGITHVTEQIQFFQNYDIKGNIPYTIDSIFHRLCTWFYLRSQSWFKAD